MTLFEITDRYPETIPVFTASGFSAMEDPLQREKFGKSVNLTTALKLKKVDFTLFSSHLIEAIEQKGDSSLDITRSEKGFSSEEGSLNVAGLLPCPVRIPLLEKFTSFEKDFTERTGVVINYELQAASMGLKWVEENIQGITEASELPDMFFDREMIGQFKDQGVFQDTTGLDRFNELFSGEDLKDPAGHYGMIGVVPAVFLINTEELGDLELPRSWADILKPEFEKRVSLPVGDFDLFNAILLNIHKNYGDEGVEKLGRSLLESMHPSQMVRSGSKAGKRPIVTIMPYFFTRMVKEGGTMEAVWPSDGAIISPIFMLSRKEKIKSLQPVIDFFASVEVGEILAHKGLFPSIHPDVDNKIEPGKKFMWLAWDYIYANDISELISHCVNVFEQSLEAEVN